MPPTRESRYTVEANLTIVDKDSGEEFFHLGPARWHVDYVEAVALQSAFLKVLEITEAWGHTLAGILGGEERLKQMLAALEKEKKKD